MAGGGLSDEDYADFEQSIYEAAIIPENWRGVLGRLGDVSDSAGAALLCINERGVSFVAAPVLDKVFERFIGENWDARNSRRGNVVAKGLVGLPRFVNEDDYMAPGEADRDPMIQELFRPEGFGWAAGFIQQLPHGDLAILNLEQYWERGPIRGEALARLDSLYPHLARSAMLAARNNLERARTAVETLAAVGLAAAAVTPTGRVVIANDAFATASHVWTTRGGDRLGLHDEVADAMLGDALRALSLARSPRSVPVRAQAGGVVTAVVQIVPIRRAAHDIFGSTDAIVVLSEPRSGAAEATLVQSLFDLTPAEIAVAQAIAAGQSPGQIARATGRSIDTIRNQLRSAMTKTGSRRQVELALLMRQLGRPV